ncbi:DUF2332 domain-containing protein [Nocardioides sp. HM23]|uniref:DUF2332 domain-containing protein n=1 Tax=Nocardioides bizhenqiangii TaxID=3095076 RepID=UPI002ACA8753|nr:DUF2332 domain-containing protein [Nocardioides sp. HM23]MDZ5619502.1 DUF2332 domain-containing protein [Nocardioides sp. HM23]
MRLYGPINEKYEEFASYAEDSPCLQSWAYGVAADSEIQEWLSTLPEPKQQPNLVFAAARWHGLDAPAPYEALREALLTDDGRIRATILARATQTNEAGRMATLLPAIAHAAGGRPVALLEAGASAGLCLYPDRWGYRWSTADGIRTAGPAAPTLHCEVTGPAPLPDAVPTVGWRGGIDLNPLDVTSEDHMSWLLTLVWPEHEDRRAQLATAIEVARPDPPDLRRGDLVELLPALVDEAGQAVGPDGVVVVFHSAVIAYLDDGARTAFADLMAGLVAAGRCRWVSNEGPNVLKGVTATGPMPPTGQFVLGLDGRSVGHTHGHGRTLHWW